MVRLFVVVLLVLVSGVKAFPDRKSLIKDGVLPDPDLTPGSIFDNVTKDDVSKPGYAETVRSVQESVKKEVFKEYGLTNVNMGDYEVDHLISLELGGSNDVKNLWPEPYKGKWNAHIKDKLEDHLHMLVLHGDLTLDQAQHEIASDWTVAYRRYFGEPK